MTKEHFAALHADGNILYFNEDSGNVVFSCKEIGILNILIIKMMKMEMILILLFISDFWLGMLNLKNAKSLKKDK